MQASFMALTHLAEEERKFLHLKSAIHAFVCSRCKIHQPLRHTVPSMSILHRYWYGYSQLLAKLMCFHHQLQVTHPPMLASPLTVAKCRAVLPLESALEASAPILSCDSTGISIATRTCVCVCVCVCVRYQLYTRDFVVVFPHPLQSEGLKIFSRHTFFVGPPLCSSSQLLGNFSGHTHTHTHTHTHRHHRNALSHNTIACTVVL